jgi:ABC-type sugar transport system ATPase subunit
VANLFLEGQEPDDLLNTPEGDVEGVDIFGLSEEAIKADLLEVQLVQEGGLVGLIGLVGADGQGLAEMLEVAGESRGRQAEISGQDATGLAGHEPAVDLH